MAANGCESNIFKFVLMYVSMYYVFAAGPVVW